MNRSSPLELLHPDGNVSTALVLGSNCPENLFPERQIDSDQKIGLLVIAPSKNECKMAGWLEKAVHIVDQRLLGDGLCYVLAPLPWRLKLIRLVSKANFVMDESFWHFPDWASSDYLVPFQRSPVQFAVERIVSAPRWKRILAREILRSTNGRKFLSMFWKPVGISVRRPGARPLFEWISKSEHNEASSRTAVIRQSWRGSWGANILYCFAEDDVLPSVIAKTTSVEDSATGLDREAEALETLGPVAQSAGVHVPQTLWKEHNNQRSVLFLSPVRGQPASDVLASDPDRLLSILNKMIGWLERWHLATVHVRTLDVEQLEQDVFVPLEQLASFLQNAEEYRDWLADRLRAVVGTPLPLVATHNDLTMANVLVNEHDSLGVVDWDTGMPESWPLVDFYYAVTDAVRIAQEYADWLEAFKACYQPNGPYTPKVACLEERLRSAVRVSPRLAELCFHACWLHHASNEQRVAQPGEPRPFLQIVQWLALHYVKSNENRN